MTSLFSASWKNPGLTFYGLSRAAQPTLAWQQGLSVGARSIARSRIQAPSIMDPSSYAAAWLRTPATPPVTNLIGWWDASVTASMTLSGLSEVTAIADQSGNGNNLTGVGTPVYGATIFNSNKPGIRYDSTQGDGLINSAFPLGTGNTLTLFGVFKMNDPAIDGLGAFAKLFSYNASGQANDFDNAASFSFVRDNGTSNVEWVRNSATSTSVAFGYATARRLIITVKSDGTVAIYVDGVATSSALAAANWTSLGYFGLGISKNNSTVLQQYGGQIGEAGVSTAWHDATAVAAIDSYLQTKWGL